jgi:hypothetical protein
VRQIRTKRVNLSWYIRKGRRWQTSPLDITDAYNQDILLKYQMMNKKCHTQLNTSYFLIRPKTHMEFFSSCLIQSDCDFCFCKLTITPQWDGKCVHRRGTEPGPPAWHPDTQATFTSVASFNALTKSDTIQRVSRPFPSKNRFPPIPRARNCRRAVLLSVWITMPWMQWKQ